MQANDKIKVIILDDHQSIVDGYVMRLSQSSQIEVTSTLSFGDELEPAIRKDYADVVILDINVPISPENSQPYPILHTIPNLLQQFPKLNILVISMFAEKGLIRGVMEAGANGYVLKDDRDTIVDLANVVLTIANGGVYFSQRAYQLFLSHQISQSGADLSPRQCEALSLCAAYPDVMTAELATRMAISHSTFRNLLSGAYAKLNVRTRTAAIAKAQNMGIITPTTNYLPQRS